LSPKWIDIIANSQNAALVLSLLVNMVLAGAIWRLWKSREALQDKVTGMLTDLLKELTRLTSNMIGRSK